VLAVLKQAKEMDDTKAKAPEKGQVRLNPAPFTFLLTREDEPFALWDTPEQIWLRQGGDMGQPPCRG